MSARFTAQPAAAPTPFRLRCNGAKGVGGGDANAPLGPGGSGWRAAAHALRSARILVRSGLSLWLERDRAHTPMLGLGCLLCCCRLHVAQRWV
jgi:hypothetical protein